MKIKYLIALSLAILSGGILSAQSEESSALRRCGVGLEDGALIMERMLENRRNISAEQIQQFVNSRATKYIPVKVHIIGDANGNGYANIDNVLGSICDLNRDYATQDVKFYLKDVTNSIRYANNQSVYNDGASFAANSYMVSNKSANCINIYISASVNNQVASYYTGFGDFIFMLNQMANLSSSTSSHEVGHFFSLAHTFYGWENDDVTVYGTGNVPSSVSGNTTERFARSGGCSNCATAGDGFCDTPADYMSDRANCPYSGAKDFCGISIDPEESLIMSYYADACVDSFSPEQKNAVAADIISRGWQTFTIPVPNNDVTGSGVTATTPAQNSTFPLSGDVTLTWSAVTGATAYVLVLERTIFGTPVEEVVKTIVYGSNTYTVPQADLSQPRTYSWKVKPFNQMHTCSGYSTPFNFTTSLASGVDVNFREVSEMRILSNPVNTSSAEILVSIPQEMPANIKIFGMDGRQFANIENVQLYAGDNVQMLDVSTLSNGVYMVVVSTEKGSLQQKMVITR